MSYTKETNNYIRRTALLLAVVILFGVCAVILPTTAVAAESYAYSLAVSNGDGVNVRSAPGTGYRVMSTLDTGETAQVLSSVTGEDGKTWYRVRSDWGYEGYVRSDLVTVTELSFSASTVSDYDAFTSGLLSQGFPESYLPGLLYLHSLYPSWSFQAVNTGLDFQASVDGESVLWASMVEPNCLSSWKSTQEGAYNWTTGKWIGLDGSWNQASPDIIAYYMDPRNFLSPSAVFQFLSQSFDGASDGSDKSVFLENLRTMATGSFLLPDGQESVTYSNNNETINYLDTLYEVGKNVGVSPYCLASMILVEQGVTGSTMISGDVSGYEGLYNFFNIGAYTTSHMTATQRGLWYAGGGDSGNTSYSRPWDTRLKSIQGGAEWFYDEYISVGQNTLYTKRFNVTPTNPNMLYRGQYMASIYGAAIEGCINARGYSEEMRRANLVFYIPVYRDMPDATVMPLADGSPNNKLASLSVDGCSLTPTFSANTEIYSVVVPGGASELTITAASADQNATVTIAGQTALSVKVPVSSGDNRIEIIVTAPNGEKRTYVIVATLRGSAYSDLYFIEDGTAAGIQPGTKVSSFLGALRFGEGAVTKVLNAEGNEKTADEILATGDTLQATLTDGTLMVYTVIIYGDVNGDGAISNADRIKIRNHILGSSSLTGAFAVAADVNRDGKISNADRIQVRNYVLGTGGISQ